MKIIQRLYLKDFLKLLAMLVLGLSTIFSLLDLSGKLDSFIPGKPSAGSLVLYAVYNMPGFLIYLLPMSVLICSLFTFSQASRRKEIVAIKTAGGQLRSLFTPFVAAGVCLSIFAFLMGEMVLPDFSKRSVELRNALSGKAKKIAFTEGSLWLKDKKGSPVKIDLYVVDRKIAEGIGIFVMGQDFLKEEIMAQTAHWNGSTWILENVKKYDMQTGRMEQVRTMQYADLGSPNLFSENIDKPEEMGIAELYRYMQRLKKAGFRNTRLAVDVNSKISFPLINFFMILLGISLSLRINLGGGLFSAGLGLLLSLCYWFGFTLSLSLGYAGILPPVLAAWTVPVVFGSAAVYLFAKMPE
jgi:lipopolysaccharide export system permease protein